MDDSDMVDKKHDLSNCAQVLSSSSFKESDVIGNESVFYEKFLLDDLDNYWDEVKDRLTVSRMVSDSVIKGMVNAVVEESEERIALKEAEISRLNKELQFYHTNFYETVDCSLIEDLGRLRLVAKEQIQKLKEDLLNVTVSSSNGRVNSSADLGLCSILSRTRSNEKLAETNERIESLGMIVETLFKEVTETYHTVTASMFEQKWEYEFERKINTVVIQSRLSTIHEEFAKKLSEQRNLIDMLNKNCKQSINELSSMREDLDSLSRSLSSSDSGPLLSHNSLDNFEEWNTSKRNDHISGRLSGNHHFPYTTTAEENGNTLVKQSEDCEKPMMEFADPSQLKQMSKDELASYYKTEMIKMRRQHDLALQEKTEELFKLKREFLREKGSSLFKKDKEFELLKKKIPEVILKLDGILLEKEKFSIAQSDPDELCSLKGNIDTLHSENEHLRGLLSEKMKEVKNLSSQVSDTVNQMSLHSSTDAKLLLQINRLEGELKDVKIEASIRDELCGLVLKEIISDNKCVLEDAEIEARFMQDTYITIIRGFIADEMSKSNSIIANYLTEKSALEALLCEKERTTSEEIEEKKKLKEAIKSLSILMKEKEQDASITGSTLMQQKQQFDILNQEIDLLRTQIAKQELLISDSKVEADSMKRRLDEALKQIHDSEMEINNLDKKLLNATTALEEAEKQKIMLHGVIEDKENKLLSSITKEKQQAKHMDAIVSSLMALSKAYIDFENKVAKNFEKNEARLKILSRRWIPIVQQTNILSTKALLYKQMLDLRSSNLLKAEAEVDLLGDEVDALLSLLGKIYIALDHYSPVLQHYPGVMETLKLVQRELEGETTRSV